MPGHQINLKVVCEEGTPTTFQWSLPGRTFKKYDVSDTKGTLTKLAGADLTGATVQFYWADVGNGRNVTVSFKVGSKNCSASAKLNVRDPTVTFPTGYNPPPIGTVKIAGGHMELRDALATNANGIVFRAKVTRPGGFHFKQAKWEYGQLIKENRTRKRNSGECKGLNSNGAFVNDNPSFPYKTGASPAGPPWNDGVTATVVDSPFQMLAPVTQILWDNIEWRMYIMFKPGIDPPGAGPSEWVPLRRCDWSVSACAQIDSAGSWVVVRQTPHRNAWQNDRIHPQWTTDRSHLPDNIRTCPPPCAP